MYSVFWAVGDLRCCVQAFSSCDKRGPVSSSVAQSSHCSGFSCCIACALGRSAFSSCSAWPQWLCCMGLDALWHVEPSQTRDRTLISCMGTWALSHWSTGEVPCFPLSLAFMHVQISSILKNAASAIISKLVTFYISLSSHNSLNVYGTLYGILCIKNRWQEYTGQISSVAQSCPTLWDPMNYSTPDLPVYHHLPEFTQTHIH